MWITLLIWFLIIAVLAAGVLLLARAESRDEAFSSRIPDGREAQERKERAEEAKRGSTRIVAPGIVIQPQPQSLADFAEQQTTDAESVVATSSRVVEVKSLKNPRLAHLVSQTDDKESATPEGTSQRKN